MNFTAIISGSQGAVASGFCKSVLVSQLGFDLSRAAMASSKQAPVRDEAEEQALREAMGDSGVPQPVKLDLGEIVDGYAAAFVLLSRHASTPDSETGRKPEHLSRYLKTPGQLVQESVDFRLNSQMTQIQATATMLGANPEARIKAVKDEIAAQAAAHLKPIQAQFFAALKAYRDTSDEELIDVALEALVNTGRKPVEEIKRAANALLDSQRKRFEDGKFATVDPSIWALAGRAQA